MPSELIVNLTFITIRGTTDIRSDSMPAMGARYGASMATKKLSFIDQVVVELERIATETGLPFFVDDRHNTRYSGRTVQIGHVAAGESIRETTVAVSYEILDGVVHFTFKGAPYTSERFSLNPGDDRRMVAFLDIWEKVANGTWEDDDDPDHPDGDDKPWPVAPPFGLTGDGESGD